MLTVYGFIEVQIPHYMGITCKVKEGQSPFNSVYLSLLRMGVVGLTMFPDTNFIRSLPDGEIFKLKE